MQKGKKRQSVYTDVKRCDSDINKVTHYYCIIKHLPGYCYGTSKTQFPKWQECPCYANEVTQGGPLDRFRMWTGYQKIHVIRSLGLCAVTVPREVQGAGGWFNYKANDLIKQPMLWDPNEISGHPWSENLPGWWAHWYVERVTHPDSTGVGTWKLCIWSLSDLILYGSSFDCLWVVTFFLKW